MNDYREIKRSKVIEVQLRQAAELLGDPSSFQLPELEVDAYADDLRRPYLEQAMTELETLALNVGYRSGFWRRLKKVAQTLHLDQKAQKYEQEFHRALARDV